MEIEELFSRLDRHRGSFPQDLVEEAIRGREEVIPAFLEILDDINKNPDPWAADEGRMVHIYAMYLLALFRETRAYPLLVKIFAHPGEFPFDLAGDVVTQDLASILASVSGGDPAGMMTLIENTEVNEWVRGQAMDAMAKLVVIGQLGRDETMSYFLQLFRKLEREPSAAWDGLANACADLWPHEALYELNRAYKDGLVNPGSIGWKDIERALALGKDGALEETRRRELLIDDVAREMGWMMCFRKRERVYKSDDNLLESKIESAGTGAVTTPIRRDKPKIGRNDPCTCGSGKKFKKCCGANEQSAAVQ
jgi:hypothetical protein